MAHNHKGHTQEVKTHNSEDSHQTQPKQCTTNENTTPFNQNNEQCVNVQYARQNNAPYGNRYVVQQMNPHRTAVKYIYPYVKQNLNQYHQQQNYAYPHLGPMVYNQQHMNQPHLHQYTNHMNPQYVNKQHFNQQYPNLQQMNQQLIQQMNQQYIQQHANRPYTYQQNQQQLIQQQTNQKQPNQQNYYHQPRGEINRNHVQSAYQCETINSQNEQPETTSSSKPEEPSPTTCNKKIRILKCKSKSDKSKCKIIKSKSRIYKCKSCKPSKSKPYIICKCKPCILKSKICSTCKSKLCKCKCVLCKCNPCKCKNKTGKCKLCKCNKLKIKIFYPCSQTGVKENKENQKNDEIDESLLKEPESKSDKSETSKFKTEPSQAKIDLHNDPNGKSNDDKKPSSESSHTFCQCDHHSMDKLNDPSTMAKRQETIEQNCQIISEQCNKIIHQNDNKKNEFHGILKKNSGYHDEDSRLLLTKNQSYPQPDHECSQNHTCECRSMEVKTPQNKIITQENNMNQISIDGKNQNDKNINQYQAIVQRKNTLPHYHLDNNRVLLPKINRGKKAARKNDRHNHYYELHTHNFSKKPNDLIVNQVTRKGKSEFSNQENPKSTLNYRHDDLSQLQLISQTKNQLDKESHQNCFEGNPKEIQVQPNIITKYQGKIQNFFDDLGKNTKDLNFKSKNIIEKMKNRNDEPQTQQAESEIYHQTVADTGLKSPKVKSKLPYLQQKRKDAIQDSISFCSVM